MTAPHDPSNGEPPSLRKSTDTGSSPLSGSYDPTAGYQGTTGYPAAPPQYPTPGMPAPFDAPAAQPAPYGAPGYGAPGYDPAAYSPPPYGQPPYAAGGYGSPYPFATPPRNGMGTAGLVLGIIGVVLCWSPLGIILGILAVIFGGVGLARAKRGEATNRGPAMAGLVLGIVALVVLVVLLSIGIAVAGAGFTSSG